MDLTELHVFGYAAALLIGLGIGPETYLLGALAWHHPSLAVALGVVVLALLAIKYPIHAFAYSMIDERDLTSSRP